MSKEKALPKLKDIYENKGTAFSYQVFEIDNTGEEPIIVLKHYVFKKDFDRDFKLKTESIAK